MSFQKTSLKITVDIVYELTTDNHTHSDLEHDFWFLTGKPCSMFKGEGFVSTPMRDLLSSLL